MGYRIRIDNLPPEVDQYLLRKAFENFGYILYCSVVEDNYGISLGYGFVEFENKDSAYSAYRKLDRARFNGIRVYITVE